MQGEPPCQAALRVRKGQALRSYEVGLGVVIRYISLQRLIYIYSVYMYTLYVFGWQCTAQLASKRAQRAPTRDPEPFIEDI